MNTSDTGRVSRAEFLQAQAIDNREEFRERFMAGDLSTWAVLQLFGVNTAQEWARDLIDQQYEKLLRAQRRPVDAVAVEE